MIIEIIKTNQYEQIISVIYNHSVIQKDLRDANFTDYVVVTDRGYNSIQPLENFILTEKKAIMCMKTGTSMIRKKIEELGDFSVRTDSMAINAQRHIYHRQYNLEYKVKSRVERRRPPTG